MATDLPGVGARRRAADSAASNTISLLCPFFVSVIRWPLRMPISTSDATAATNALAGAITDPSARVAANPGARASVISPLRDSGNAEGAHHDLAHSLFNNTEVPEDDIPSQHMCLLTCKPPFDAIHFDVPDGASVTTAANQQVYERSALFRCSWSWLNQV